MSANDKGSIFSPCVLRLCVRGSRISSKKLKSFSSILAYLMLLRKVPQTNQRGTPTRSCWDLYKGETTVRLCPSKLFQALMAGWLYISIHILHFQPGHIAKHGTILQLWLYLLKHTKNPDPKFHMIHHCESWILDHRLVAYIWFRFGQFVLYIIVHLIRDSSQNVLSKIGC